MIPRPIVAEIRDWTARNARAAKEHELNPLTHGTVSGPCLSCGRTTRHHDGYCSHHRPRKGDR